MKNNIQMTLRFATLVYASICAAATAHAEVNPRAIEIFDHAGKYNFGALNSIPIDTQFIEPSVCNLLDSCTADSVVRIFSEFDPADTLLTRADGTVVKLLDLSRIYKIYFTDSVVWNEFDSLYGVFDTVSELTQDFRAVSTSIIPNDPEFFFQSFLDSSDGNDGRISATVAWETTKGNSSQLIGMVDTGIDGDHPEFTGRLAGGINVSSPLSPWDEDSEPDGGHGSSVAGLMIANTDNAIAVAGINWNARIFVARMQDEDSDAGAFSVSNSTLAKGIDGAGSSGAEFVNVSFGGPGGGNASLKAACFNVWAKGISLVASKGNDGVSDFYSPSDYFTAIGVGAVRWQDGLKASFSNTGNGIRVAAPGSGGMRTVAEGAGASTRSFAGTSAAAPVAVGVLSLIRSANVSLDADEAEEIMYFDGA